MEEIRKRAIARFQDGKILDRRCDAVFIATKIITETK